MTQEQKIIRWAKVGWLLELARQLGNVSSGLQDDGATSRDSSLSLQGAFYDAGGELALQGASTQAQAAS